MKSKSTAYILWFFLGIFGAHKFYLNKVGMGVLYLFTGGIFGIGWFIDLFTLGSQVDTYNALFYRPFLGNSSVNTNIVVNVPGNDAKAPSHATIQSISEQLQTLHDLKEKGILSEEEFTAQKSKILA